MEKEVNNAFDDLNEKIEQCDRALEEYKKLLEQMKKKYRILEYKDCFEIEKEVLEKEIVYFLNIPIWVKYKNKFRCISKNGVLINIHNLLKEDFRFKSYEECIQHIKDLEKYPIIHEVKL